MRSSNTSIKFFPFSPGVPYKLERSRYVLPELDGQIWNDVLAGKDAVVTAYGGLLESFYSLSILEALNSVDPTRSLYWLGHPAFNRLASLQGLTKTKVLPIDKDNLSNYPVPLFFDNDDNGYFNCLNNYITKKSYTHSYTSKTNKPNRKPVVEQIFENSMLDWDGFTPNLRNLSRDTQAFDRWKRIEKFAINRNYVVLLPDRTGYSQHSVDCLNWTNRNISHFVALMNHNRIPVVICSKNLGDYYDLRCHKTSPDLMIMLHLLKHAKVVLASEIDFLMLGLSNNTTIMSRKIKEKHFNLYKNADYLSSESVISVSEELNPMDVSMEIVNG